MYNISELRAIVAVQNRRIAELAVEPNEVLVITQSGTDIALPTLDEQAHRDSNEAKQ